MDRIQAFFENLWERIKRWFENPTRRNYTIGTVLLLIASFILPVSEPHVSLKAEPIFAQGFPWLTNALITTLVVDVILIVLAVAARSQIREIPTGFGNFMEFVVEGLFNLTESVAGRNARKFFPWVATIFLLVIVSNYSGLIPGVGSIGFYHDEAYHAEEGVVVEEGEPTSEVGAETGASEESDVIEPEVVDDEVADTAADVDAAEEEHHAIFVPLFRAPSADLNFTFALAITTMILVQYWGFRALGGSYFKKFFNFSGTGFMKGINIFSGLLELISEFAKIVSFAFRLFGNIFAGEVLLAVMAFLVAFLIPVPFYGLELFVGFIQALVFMMLAVVFFATAVISHGHDDHH